MAHHTYVLVSFFFVLELVPKSNSDDLGTTWGFGSRLQVCQTGRVEFPQSGAPAREFRTTEHWEFTSLFEII